jgi:hypothetical protein
VTFPFIYRDSWAGDHDTVSVPVHVGKAADDAEKGHGHTAASIRRGLSESSDDAGGTPVYASHAGDLRGASSRFLLIDAYRVAPQRARLTGMAEAPQGDGEVLADMNDARLYVF